MDRIKVGLDVLREFFERVFGLHEGNLLSDSVTITLKCNLFCAVVEG